MNRAQRRAEQQGLARAALRQVKAMGCTCTPKLTHQAANLDGRRTPGVMVEHQEGSGCPLGALALKLNKAGIIPSDPVTVGGCAR